jgi:hypothetical protein
VVPELRASLRFKLFAEAQPGAKRAAKVGMTSL